MQTGSLSATHDALRALKRENTELVKKKNDLARQLQAIGCVPSFFSEVLGVC